MRDKRRKQSLGYDKRCAESRAAPSTARASTRVLAGLILVVTLAVLYAHWPALSARAILFDDQQYVTENHLVQHPSWNSTRRFLEEVLTPSTVQGYYQPLTMISLMVDWANGGRTDNLRPFHRTNLALHILTTALVIVLLYSLFGQPWVAALVGLLFGLHPLTVEPIAWVGERKTLLAAFFSLLCLILYVRHARRASRAAYSACMIMYVLALMAKPTSTPLPALMLLLDFWPLHRLNRRAVLEKIPFFVIGGASALITVLSQGRTAAVQMPSEYSAERIPLILCHNTVFYLWKIIWPAHLSQHYPFPSPFAVSSPAVLAGVVGTVILVAALLLSLRRTRALLTGWLFFFVAIFPTMGVIGFTMVIAADKYAYLPSVGLMLSLTWLLTRLWGSRPRGAPVALRRMVLAGGILIVAAAEAFATRAQLVRWQDTETLYRHMLAAAPNSPVVHNDLGAALVERGKTDEAVAHYNKALELYPEYPEPYYNRGMVHKDKGDYDQAIADFTQAIRLKPRDAAARNNRGNACLMTGDFDRALADYSAAIELRPDYAEAYNNRGFAHGRRGEFAQAIRDLSRAIELAPDYGQAYNNRAAAYFSVRAYDKAWADVRACRRFGGTPAPELVQALTEATGRSE